MVVDIVAAHQKREIDLEILGGGEEGIDFCDKFWEDVWEEGLSHGLAIVWGLYEVSSEEQDHCFCVVIIENHNCHQNASEMHLIALIKGEKKLLGLVPLETEEGVKWL